MGGFIGIIETWTSERRVWDGEVGVSVGMDGGVNHDVSFMGRG